MDIWTNTGKRNDISILKNFVQHTYNLYCNESVNNNITLFGIIDIDERYYFGSKEKLVLDFNFANYVSSIEANEQNFSRFLVKCKNIGIKKVIIKNLNFFRAAMGVVTNYGSIQIFPFTYIKNNYANNFASNFTLEFHNCLFGSNSNATHTFAFNKLNAGKNALSYENVVINTVTVKKYCNNIYIYFTPNNYSHYKYKNCYFGGIIINMGRNNFYKNDNGTYRRLTDEEYKTYNETGEVLNVHLCLQAMNDFHSTVLPVLYFDRFPKNVISTDEDLGIGCIKNVRIKFYGINLNEIYIPKNDTVSINYTFLNIYKNDNIYDIYSRFYTSTMSGNTYVNNVNNPHLTRIKQYLAYNIYETQNTSSISFSLSSIFLPYNPYNTAYNLYHYDIQSMYTVIKGTIPMDTIVTETYENDDLAYYKNISMYLNMFINTIWKYVKQTALDEDIVMAKIIRRFQKTKEEIQIQQPLDFYFFSVATNLYTYKNIKTITLI